MDRCWKFLGSVVAIALSSCAVVRADSVERLRQQGYSVTTVTPIFGQLLRTGYPKGFVHASEKVQPQFYIRESVLTGETVSNWTQMLTITGAKDLASKPGATPKAVLESLAGGFKRACPGSFGAHIIDETKVSGFDAVAAVVSCGVSPTTAGKTSETALMVVIKGQADVYTVQWAERAAPSNLPIPVDVAKWSDRYKRLGPFKLCPVVAGERAPYPSCVGSGEKSPV